MVVTSKLPGGATFLNSSFSGKVSAAMLAAKFGLFVGRSSADWIRIPFRSFAVCPDKASATGMGERSTVQMVITPRRIAAKHIKSVAFKVQTHWGPQHKCSRVVSTHNNEIVQCVPRWIDKHKSCPRDEWPLYWVCMSSFYVQFTTNIILSFKWPYTIFAKFYFCRLGLELPRMFLLFLLMSFYSAAVFSVAALKSLRWPSGDEEVLLLRSQE